MYQRKSNKDTKWYHDSRGTYKSGAFSISLNGPIGNVTVFKNSPNSICGTKIGKQVISADTVQINYKNSAVECLTNEKCSKGDKYPVKRSTAGYVLIINQLDFYIYENRKKVQNKKLPQRSGSNKDKMDLKQIFEDRGYRIVEKENLTDEEIVEEIKKIVKLSSAMDSLIVCILSHGEEGVIYGSNSKTVSLMHIQDLIELSEHLRNKPKVLIVQACQGGEILSVKKTSSVKKNIECDGPSKEAILTESDGASNISVPAYRDFCVCKATIPRFSALRDVENGSWFVQTLCDIIEMESHRKHFLDIMTIVIREVTERRLRGVGCMVPVQESTFSKYFYLPLKIKPTEPLRKY